MELLPTLWIQKYKIKNESGIELDFHDHAFLWDIYNDFSPLQVILKPPQIGATVMMILKSLFAAKKKKRDIIYTLPTQSDVTDMGGGKVNRLIAQNPILAEWVKDHDTIEQKTVGDHIIYFRGTFTTKQAMMVSSSLNIHDEVDASKEAVIVQYETRLQAIKDGWRWYFSHPSDPDTGVDKYWAISDQKHWFIKCTSCKKEQYLSWPDSIDQELEAFICKYCSSVLSDDDRRKGRWVAKYKKSDKRPFSGYWISQLMCAWISAKKIISDFKHKPPSYFHNYVLGLPHIGSGNKLTKDMLMQNLTPEMITPDEKERVVMGVDTGLKLDYVLGAEKGLFMHGEAEKWEELDALMKRWSRMIAIVDAGGDLIGSRAFQARYPGRVFLCYTGGNQKNTDEPKWNEDTKFVTVDREKMIQLTVDEFRDNRIPLQGDEDDWYDYWLDWNNLHREKQIDDKTGVFKGYKWIRGGRDHLAMATVYWRVGMTRFSKVGAIYNPKPKLDVQKGYEIAPDDTVKADLSRLFKPDESSEDWRQ